METKLIDAHIHLDFYTTEEQKQIIESLDKHQIEGLITVSQNLKSAKSNLALSKTYCTIQPAFGYHPEQTLPSEKEIVQLTEFILTQEQDMVAIGEVGLPYYLRQETDLKLEEYINLLEHFIMLAKRTKKPIILHAVYEDAPVVCSLLEKHSIDKAHFHWFKGDDKTMQRMLTNGYFISVTPDIVYKPKIQRIAKQYPLEQLMVETDGPWPFSGPFENKRTHPKMLHESIKVIAHLKQIDRTAVYQQIYENTRSFFTL
ncbi:TatD family hydrolase [Oceanobacillus indicireducens]|uniref:Uncharacterized protein n=1 Tax=Oceanobacillus indicireducens TaxID=1004261 RepID=A0A917XTM5_9BACI|nr:TatD family hydrolase [Oceanobacillus indicireducens]GGN51862.1 hypothetical protein GCM10007971_06810 [Oceanobacillus indicireducens]